MAKKLTYKFVKEQFEREGYKLLSNVYENNRQKLDYICPKGHKHKISWSNWGKGARCPYCANCPPVNISFIRFEFEREGYTLLTTKYKNAFQKLKYVCPKGHNGTITWCNWKQRRRCFQCGVSVGSSKRRLMLDMIRKSFSDENYLLLSVKYKNTKQKLEYVCPKGHKHLMRWDHFNNGHRCPTCAGIKQSIKYSAENNPAWKGGISCEPYCDVWLDKEFKQSIKDRDGNICLNPDCRKNCDHLPLHIHHIDDNKKNCVPSNLITVCNSCNQRAKKDREWHTAWYNTIMYRRKTNVIGFK